MSYILKGSYSFS